MMWYFRNLYPQYPKHWDICRDAVAAFDLLVLQVSVNGFFQTDIAPFRKFSDAVMTMTRRMYSELGMWSDATPTTAGLRLGMFPSSVKELHHLSYLLEETRKGRLDGMIADIRTFGEQRGKPFLPFNVQGQNFAIEDGEIPANSIKSMLYVEIQFGIIGKVDLAKQLWRQLFPLGTTPCSDDEALKWLLGDEDRAADWWLDQEAEGLVSRSYHRGFQKEDAEDSCLRRESLSPVPQCYKYFRNNFPKAYQTLRGETNPKLGLQSNYDLVSALWPWVDVYEQLQGGLGMGNYVVIPHRVLVKDFLANYQPSYDNERVRLVRKVLGGDIILGLAKQQQTEEYE